MVPVLPTDRMEFVSFVCPFPSSTPRGSLEGHTVVPVLLESVGIGVGSQGPWGSTALMDAVYAVVV